MTIAKRQASEINWLNPLRGIALLAILLNHFVEEFGSYPWFTFPSNDWPDFATRMSKVFPRDYSSVAISLVQFAGWLGDNGPGVFILVSGIGLTWSLLNRPGDGLRLTEYFKRRLARIFPLYIAMHFVILAGSLFVPGSQLSLASRRTLLSLLGLRFTDSLFFYINPSWWFIWLIIQLYLVFPILYWLMQRVGWKYFLAISFGFTFMCRVYGLWYSESLFYWMAGIFFGTRLVEFSTGMVLATLLFQYEKTGAELPGTGQVLKLAVPVYAVGLACSFTWLGTTISNGLITLGMTGIFWGLWKGLLEKIRPLGKLILWIGIESYGIYLLHQTPLKWTAIFFSGEWHLVAAILVLVLSFPAGWLMSKIIGKIKQFDTELVNSGRFGIITTSVAILTWFGLIIAGPIFSSDHPRVFALGLGSLLVILVWSEFVSSDSEGGTQRFVRWSGISASFLNIFVFELDFRLAALVGILVATFALLSFQFVKSRGKAWTIGFVTTAILLGVGEWVLGTYFPLEAGRWGELPALQIHPTRTYSLKPNKVTRLKYNNYDYILRTNSFGLASPDLKAAKPMPDTLRILVLGNAFSMPEGLEYEDSYPALLERKLNQDSVSQTVQVVNAGVTGYSFREEYHQLKELGPMFKPDVVILQSFVTEFSWVHLSPDYRLRESGLVRRERSSVTDNLLERSQIKEHLQRIQSFLPEKLTGISGPWRYDKSLLRYYRVGDNQYYTEERLAEIEYYLAGIKRICWEMDSHIVIYFVPAAIAVCNPSELSYFPLEKNIHDKSIYDLEKPFRNLQRIATELGIPIVDLTPYLRNYPVRPLYFRESWHWNREGHKAAADTIAKDLLTRGYLLLGNKGE
jgi:peptidoglycan/LPS O-acetylase OafA/YrhL